MLFDAYISHLSLNRCIKNSRLLTHCKRTEGNRINEKREFRSHLFPSRGAKMGAKFCSGCHQGCQYECQKSGSL